MKIFFHFKTKETFGDLVYDPYLHTHPDFEKIIIKLSVVIPDSRKIIQCIDYPVHIELTDNEVATLNMLYNLDLHEDRYWYQLDFKEIF